MYRPNPRLMAAFVVGLAAGYVVASVVTSSQIKDLVAASYLRSASDARSFAQALEETRTHADAQVIHRLEADLSIALVSLSDYETVFAADRREPRIYEALAIARKYVASHPEVTLPPEAARALAMEGKD